MGVIVAAARWAVPVVIDNMQRLGESLHAGDHWHCGHWWWPLPPIVIIIALKCEEEEEKLTWGCVGVNTIGVAHVGMLLDNGGDMAATTTIVVVTALEGVRCKEKTIK